MLNVIDRIEDERFIILPNDMYCNDMYCNEEVLLYCLLQKFYIRVREQGITSINIIKDLMHVDNRNKNIYEGIREGFNKLFEHELISNVADLRNNNIDDMKNDTVFTYTLDLPEEGYFKVYDFMLDDIFKYLHTNSSNIDKFSIIRYFTSICRVLNNEGQFGYLAQSKVSFAGNSRSIARYNDIFSDLKLIQYNSNFATKEKKYTSTYFAWYGDKSFDKMLENEVSSRGLIPYKDKNKANEKRSVKQKINNIENNVASDDKSKIKELEEQLAMLKAQYEGKSNDDIKTQRQKIDEEYDKKPDIFDVEKNEEEWGVPENHYFEQPNPCCSEEDYSDDVNDNVTSAMNEIDELMKERKKEWENMTPEEKTMAIFG